jgi:hypothetical protein|tara:strand:+ start:77 stop:661 length:585 start_codon:yes stop_codon:yes gene_type:complete
MPQRTKTVINKKVIDLLKQPTGFTLNTSIEHFKQEGVMLDTTGVDSLTELSEKALFAMGITKLDTDETNLFDKDYHPLNLDSNSDYNSDFSFMTSENKDKGIENTNIVDPDVQSLSPKLIGAEDKFVAVNDPFYEQDEEKSEMFKLQRQMNKSKTKKSLIRIAAGMCGPHISHEVKNKNKYFQQFSERKRRGVM